MILKKCLDCGISKSLSEFSKDKYKKDKHNVYCFVCTTRKHKEQYQKHRDVVLARQKCYYAELKKEVLTHYGGGKLACVRCGNDDSRVLSIDHIRGDGAEERRGNKRTGCAFYQGLRVTYYPKGYQTLCMNCQFIKRVENKETTRCRNILNTGLPPIQERSSIILALNQRR